MSPTEEVASLLEADRAVLKRSKTHNIWALSNGNTFVQSKTPSDWRGDINNLAKLKRLLGIEREVRAAAPKLARVPVERVAAKRRVEASFVNNLKLAGVMRSSFQDRVSALLDEIRKGRACAS